MQGTYELAQGGVRGRDHRQSGKNYQDARHVIQTPEFTVGVVTDGCGSQPYSEVGAHLGARIVASAVYDEFVLTSEWHTIDGSTNPSWKTIQEKVLRNLHYIAQISGGEEYGRFVLEYLMFTAIGVVIGPEESFFFGVGDGHVIVNGVSIQIGPFEGNVPPYLSYGLVKSEIKPEDLEFKLHRRLPTAELEHFLIGCDGVTELEGTMDRIVPDTSDPVGPISQFWTNDRYFKNRDNVRRRLTLVNGGVNPAPGAGLLPDDTTLIVGRRKKEPTS